MSSIKFVYRGRTKIHPSIRMELESKYLGYLAGDKKTVLDGESVYMWTCDKHYAAEKFGDVVYIRRTHHTRENPTLMEKAKREL